MFARSARDLPMERRPPVGHAAVSASSIEARTVNAPIWHRRATLRVVVPDDRSSRRSEVESAAMNYQTIITVEPGKRGGQPCIRGLRITVYDVLSYLASDMTEEEILSDFPDLTHEDILASLSYAADRERKTMVSHG